MPRFLPEIPIPTPFGKVSFPQPEAPPIKIKPELDDRRRQALAQGLGMDLTTPLAMIPVLGDFLAEAISDMHEAELHRLLTDEESQRWIKYEKVSPLTTLALLRAFIRE